MIKTTLPTKRAIAYIVKRYRIIQRRRDHPLSFRDFASALSEVLRPIGGNISHQSVKNWEKMVHIPNLFYIKQVAIHAPQGWQSDFALDLLAVLNPEENIPATKIGAMALKELEN